MIAVAIAAGRDSELKTFGLKWIYCVCIYTTLVFSAMRVIIKLVLIFFGYEITPAKFSYTVGAVIVSIVLPYLVEVFKKLRIEIEIHKNEKK